MINKPAGTMYHTALADDVDGNNTVSMSVAEGLFNYFKTSSLFRWSDANNDCEDRANAICILLDAWKIPNYKGWVFSGYYLKKNYGSLINYWNYHVAPLIPVQRDDKTVYYIIDPATCEALEPIERWAVKITGIDNSYHFIKFGYYYIFPPKKIEKDNWYKRNKRNYSWTIQGLSGINGISSKGKAQLSFNKNKVKKTEEAFRRLKNEKPEFLNAYFSA